MKEMSLKMKDINGEKEYPNENYTLRDEVIKKNIYLSVLIKGISLGVSFLIVPLTINYLNVEQYGVWLVFLSILSWMNILDLGLGNGLRNKLAENISSDNLLAAREYISTAYMTIISIVIPIFTIILILAPNLNWNRIFNTSSIDNNELVAFVVVVSFMFLINFVFSLSNQMFYAIQKAVFASVHSLLLNTLFVLAILLLKTLDDKKILYLGISYGAAMIISSILITVYFFHIHKDLRPKVCFIRKKRIKDIIGVGIKFFIIQIAVIVVFTTDNMIITQVLGPGQVTSYNVVFKLFSIISIAHTLLVTPLWSAYTEAYVQRDILWIKQILLKLSLLMIPIIFAVALIIVFADQLIFLWIGEKLTYSKYLVIFMGIYTIINVWNNIFAYFLNGISALNVQMMTSIIAGIINIPISILFARNFGLGNAGVILGTIISLSLFAVAGPIQTYFELRKLKAL